MTTQKKYQQKTKEAQANDYAADTVTDMDAADALNFDEAEIESLYNSVREHEKDIDSIREEYTNRDLDGTTCQSCGDKQCNNLTWLLRLKQLRAGDIRRNRVPRPLLCGECGERMRCELDPVRARLEEVWQDLNAKKADVITAIAATV